MQLFWLKRLKQVDREESSWALSYGDLMSLLLAVFVMIAAMSELRAGDRFDTVGAAVRSAFGFATIGGDAEAGADPVSKAPLTLLERLAQAGLEQTEANRGRSWDEERLASCDVTRERDRVVIQVAGPTSFSTFSAQLRPEARRAVARIAGFLIEGQTRVEIRGHNGDGRLPAEALFRDGLDLSYARARVVADELIAAGVPKGRLHVAAWGDSDPLPGKAGSGADGMNRRVEIIVHAATAAVPTRVIAEKERVNDG